MHVYLLQVCVAPAFAIGPCSGDEFATVIVPLLGPVAPLDAAHQPRRSVGHVHLVVLARGPEHRPPQRVVLNPEGEFAVVVVNLPNARGLVEIDGQHVSIVSLVWVGKNNNNKDPAVTSTHFDK